jgi:UDP-glucose 4-epimerase
MKILLTGCVGLVGSHTYNSLTDMDIYGVDNLSFGFSEATPHGFLVDGFENILESHLNTYDILVHMATVDIQHSHLNHLEAFKTNAVKTVELFSKFKGKIVYTSTASVYGNASEFPTKETAVKNVSNAYDMSKYLVELYLKLRGNYTTLRLSNVYGKTVPERQYKNVIEAFSASDVVTIQGDGRQTRDFTFIGDVVRAVRMAIEQEAKNTEINICSGTETNLLVLAYLMDKKVILGESRPGDTIQRRWLSNQKAKDLLGWEPEVSLQEGLKML